MIPISAITEWREHAPWSSSSQVEHDLLLSRILVEIWGLGKHFTDFAGGILCE